jgi:cardiolipin synthase
VLYAIAGLRDFRPSIFGKANTFAQVAAIFFVMLFQIKHARWIWLTQTTFLHATVAFTVVSALHYVYLVGQRLHAANHAPAAVTKSSGDSI